MLWLSSVLPIDNILILDFLLLCTPLLAFLLFPMVNLLLFYSYIMRELVAKNALALSSLPTYLSNLVNVLSSLCVYTTTPMS